MAKTIAASGLSHLKTERAFGIAQKSGIFLGSETRAHVWQNVLDFANVNVLATMSSKQLAAIIVAASKSYQAGRESCQASIEGDCVWVGGGVQKLVPLGSLRALQ